MRRIGVGTARVDLPGALERDERLGTHRGYSSLVAPDDVSRSVDSG